jgi:hypothetical protein
LFILSASADVHGLKERIINQTLVGFGEYRGPIDIYDTEGREKLLEDMRISLIRPSSRTNPLIVKIPTSGKVCLSDFVTPDS